MRKKVAIGGFIVVALLIGSLVLYAINKDQKEGNNSVIEGPQYFLAERTNTADTAANVDMRIVADYSKELVVPNPESSEKDAMVVMRYIPDFEKYEAYDEMDRCYKSCQVDLSFLGFENKMTILAFQIGAVTSYTSEYTHIEYDIPNGYRYDEDLPVLKDREINGNCLVLVAKDSLKEDDDNYMIVLDYDKKKSYVIKTSIWNPIDDHIPILQLRDFTGDGLMDIVISNSLNESYVNMQVFTFSEDKFKNIYSNLGGEEQNGDKISGHLADDYKIVFEYKPLDFKKEKSLLKLGYSKKQLRDHYNKKGNVKRSRDIQIDLAQDMKICKKNEYDYVIRYTHSVTFTKYNHVCEIYAYLKYDTKKDKMDIYDIVINRN